MWFVFGLLSFCVVLAWQLYWRWRRPWKGEGHGTAVEGIPYRRRLLRTGNGTVLGIETGVHVPEFFRFELKRETWLDRFFKWVGLSVEKQFGHDGFDRLVYVASNDEHLFNRVADSPALRNAAQSLFASGGAACPVKRVICAHGWLVVRTGRGRWLSRKDDLQRLTRRELAVVPMLEAIAKALRESERPELAPNRRDPYLLPGAALLAVSTALAINGLLFLARPIVFDDAFLLNPGRIFDLTLWAGCLIVFALLAAHVALLARSAQAHLYLIELLLVGSFGAFSTAASELREANIEWDTSAPLVREAAIVDKSISRSRKSGTSYHLHVADWHEGSAGTRRIRVSRSYYESMDKGRILLFEERPGYFKAAWARLVGAKPN